MSPSEWRGPAKPHAVVLGAGFAGIAALETLRRAQLQITIVDRNSDHAFLPLLYQVATNQLRPEHISIPVSELSGSDDFRFVQGEVTEVDLNGRKIVVNGESIEYDYLLVGLGAVVNFWGTEGAHQHAFPLYTAEDARNLQTHIASCLQRGTEPGAIEDGVLTFCVVGGGSTGVEIAGALAELVDTELARTGSSVVARPGKVYLFEAGTELLTAFAPKLRKYAEQALVNRGIEVHLGEPVAAVDPTRLRLVTGEAVNTHTVVWAAGLQSHSLAGVFDDVPAGERPAVQPDLSVSGHPEVFLAGDLAKILDTRTGNHLPQLGSVAQQSGKTAAENIALLAEGRSTKSFVYKDKGTMAMIGRGDAIVQLQSGRTMTGKPAWAAWNGVHLMLLAGGEQKAQTAVEWGKGLLGWSTREVHNRTD